MNPSIENRKRQLDAFFHRATTTQMTDESRSDLAKYGAVLVCGFIERCVELVVLERLTQLAHPRVIKFVKSHFKRGTNYECEPICQLLERFDADWASGFRIFVENNRRLEEQVSSAYTLRNSIAHGGDANRGLNGVRELYDAAKAVVDGLVAATR